MLSSKAHQILLEKKVNRIEWICHYLRPIPQHSDCQAVSRCVRTLSGRFGMAAATQSCEELHQEGRGCSWGNG